MQFRGKQLNSGHECVLKYSFQDTQKFCIFEQGLIVASTFCAPVSDHLFFGLIANLTQLILDH